MPFLAGFLVPIVADEKPQLRSVTVTDCGQAAEELNCCTGAVSKRRCGQVFGWFNF